VALWRKLHLSDLSHFKTQKSSLYKKKNAVHYFQKSPFVPEIFKFLKYANYAIDGVIHSTKFWSNMMKKDISAIFYQKCLILCSKILLNVLHNTNSTVVLPWQHTEFQTSPMLMAFLGTFGVSFWYLLIGCLVCMIQQAYEYVSSSLWHHFMFFCAENNQQIEIKWGLEKSGLPWEHNFHSRWCVSFRTIILYYIILYCI